VVTGATTTSKALLKAIENALVKGLEDYPLLQMTQFEQERKEIREKIWSLLDLSPGQKVLDVGVGRIAYSLAKLIELGTTVTAIDLDWQALCKHKTPEANMVLCDAAQVPFRSKVFEMALVNFTFHEIYPVLHSRVCSELGRVSNRIIIVEPTIANDPVFRRYQEIWTESMHSIKKFEDFRTIDYWINLLNNTGKLVTVTKSLRYSVRLHGQEARDYMKTVIDELREEGVSNKCITKMTEFTEDVIEKGIIFSDVNVIIAQT
jgi:ubiquinone/menaquinone biosynthesis C-methylase UbiE